MGSKKNFLKTVCLRACTIAILAMAGARTWATEMPPDSLVDISEKLALENGSIHIPAFMYIIIAALLCLIVVLIYVIHKLRHENKHAFTIYKAMFEATEESISLYDKDGIMVDINESGLVLTGFKSRSAAINSRLNIYENPVLGKLVDKDHPHSYKGRLYYKSEDVSNMSYGPLVEKGIDKYIGVIINPLFVDGMFAGYVIVSNDFTEMEQINQKLLKEKKRAEDADRLKSSFVANMSHEIRTPLNAIIGFTDLILTANMSEEDKTECSKLIKKNSQTLLTLVNDILDLSKLESGMMEIHNEDVDLVPFFGEVAEILSPLVKPDVEFRLDTPYKRCIASIDQERVKQVLTNFVSNAAKHTDHGHITMGFTAMPQGVRMFVEDTGEGIPQDQLENIFERFVKVNEFVPGTGLGLSIVKATVQAWNGNVGVDSKVGEGSTFWVWLPTTVRDYVQIEKS